MQEAPSLETKQVTLVRYPAQFDAVADPRTPVKPAVNAVRQVFSTQADVEEFQRHVGYPTREIAQLFSVNLAAQVKGKSIQPATVPLTGFAETHPEITESQADVVTLVLSIVVHPLSIHEVPFQPQSP